MVALELRHNPTVVLAYIEQHYSIDKH